MRFLYVIEQRFGKTFVIFEQVKIKNRNIFMRSLHRI